MVKYALDCQSCHSLFEAWFSTSDAYETQKDAGLVECPDCGGSDVRKQIMAPSVRDSKRTTVTSAQPDRKLAEMMKKVRDHIAETHEYVGGNFAETARAMHDGEAEVKPVWGEATPEEAKSLVEDGVPAMPLPGGMAPARPVDQKKLN